MTSFRNDLAAVSADIESLQARSTGLNVRLENRRAVEKGLGPLVEELSVSPLVVSKIAEGPIDEAWLKVLAEVDKRSEAYKKVTKSGQGQSRAAADLGPLLEKLTLKVGGGRVSQRPGTRVLTVRAGYRKDTGPPRRANQGFTVTTNQRADHPAAELPQVQGPVHIFAQTPLQPSRGNLPGLYEHHEVVLLQPIHPLPEST